MSTGLPPQVRREGGPRPPGGQTTPQRSAGSGSAPRAGVKVALETIAAEPISIKAANQKQELQQPQPSRGTKQAKANAPTEGQRTTADAAAFRALGTIYNILESRAAVSIKACVAEFLAMAIFVYVGCGTAMSFSTYKDSLTNTSWGIVVPLTFGLAITVLAYATAHTSGGQINCAVTIGLAMVRALPIRQAIANVGSQFLGSVAGALLLRGTLSPERRGTLGSNALAPEVSTGNAFLGEMIMTFVLMFVVLETAVNKQSIAANNAPLAIGFSVFLAHCVLLPIDGCSINPTRSFGPALISGTWGNFWIFLIAPIMGALLAVPFHLYMKWGTTQTVEKVLDAADKANEKLLNKGRDVEVYEEMSLNDDDLV